MMNNDKLLVLTEIIYFYTDDYILSFKLASKYLSNRLESISYNGWYLIIRRTLKKIKKFKFNKFGHIQKFNIKKEFGILIDLYCLCYYSGLSFVDASNILRLPYNKLNSFLKEVELIKPEIEKEILKFDPCTILEYLKLKDSFSENKKFSFKKSITIFIVCLSLIINLFYPIKKINDKYFYFFKANDNIQMSYFTDLERMSRGSRFAGDYDSLKSCYSVLYLDFFNLTDDYYNLYIKCTGCIIKHQSVDIKEFTETIKNYKGKNWGHIMLSIGSVDTNDFSQFLESSVEIIASDIEGKKIAKFIVTFDNPKVNIFSYSKSYYYDFAYEVNIKTSYY